MEEQGVVPMINIRERELRAIERYAECPKHLTIVRHADKAEDTDLHCIIATPPFVGPLRPKDKLPAPAQRDFLVPKQEVVMVQDAKYGLFSVIRVRNKEDMEEYALFTSVHSRLGFLYPIGELPFILPVSEEVTA